GPYCRRSAPVRTQGAEVASRPVAMRTLAGVMIKLGKGRQQTRAAGEFLQPVERSLAVLVQQAIDLLQQAGLAFFQHRGRQTEPRPKTRVGRAQRRHFKAVPELERRQVAQTRG